MESRAVRGYAILAQGIEPNEIEKNTFKIPSQNGKGYYIVERSGYDNHSYGRWTCTCPDFYYRGVKCKHIHAVEFWQQLKGQANVQIVKTIIPKTENRFECPYCKSDKIVKNGRRKGKTREKIRYLCKDCKKTFIDDKEFEKIKVTPEMLTATLDLYFKGVSLRKISDHVSQIYRVKIGKSTIHRWIMDYMSAINDYTKTLKPQVGGMWHTDEMMVKIEGKRSWLWNTIDNQTRFMLANNITDDRYIKDAETVFKEAKKTGNKIPDVMVTDGLAAYREAFKDVFTSKCNQAFPKHLAGVGIRGDKNNNVVERYHNTIRERDKIMRGLKSKKSAGIMHRGFKDYYNFIRPHQGLDGITPAEMAGLDLQLGQNKWMEILRKSIKG